MDTTGGRNISIEQYFQQIGQSHHPTYRFSGGDFQTWKNALLPKVLASLGPPMTKVPLNPQIVEEKREDGLIKQRVMIDLEPGLSAPILVYRPEKLEGKLPAILCCHGHGPYGKDSVMGLATDEARAKHIRELNYDYGLEMAKKGFVTAAIDWRGFGERGENKGADVCNIHYIRATLLGKTLLGMDVHDGQCALDYICSQSFVDPDRIGVMGLSFGGTMTTWMSICDERIKAADIICYSDRFPDFGLKRRNFCGSQITPGLFALCDVPDLHGLIAPRPLLVEIGKQDSCFLEPSAMSCYSEVEKIYIAAGAHEKLLLDHFDGEHSWGGNFSEKFFRKYLG
jgi:dienelactone hydrolase